MNCSPNSVFFEVDSSTHLLQLLAAIVRPPGVSDQPRIWSQFILILRFNYDFFLSRISFYSCSASPNLCSLNPQISKLWDFASPWYVDKEVLSGIKPQTCKSCLTLFLSFLGVTFIQYLSRNFRVVLSYFSPCL